MFILNLKRVSGQWDFILLMVNGIPKVTMILLKEQPSEFIILMGHNVEISGSQYLLAICWIELLSGIL